MLERSFACLFTTYAYLELRAATWGYLGLLGAATGGATGRTGREGQNTEPTSVGVHRVPGGVMTKRHHERRRHGWAFWFGPWGSR